LPVPSNADLQAQETADNLQRHIFIEVELDSDLSKRLKSLQLPADAIELENLGDRNADSAESFQRLGSSDSGAGKVEGKLPIPDTISDNNRGRSILSGLSLANISIVSVIELPLHELELIPFHRLKSPPDDYYDVSHFRGALIHLTEEFKTLYGLRPLAGSSGPGHSALLRLRKELADISREPPDMIALGPIGDDMVR
jgi:hypothetical protein